MVLDFEESLFSGFLAMVAEISCPRRHLREISDVLFANSSLVSLVVQFCHGLIADHQECRVYHFCLQLQELNLLKNENFIKFYGKSFFSDKTYDAYVNTLQNELD